MAAEVKKEIQLEIAHVLFIDIVGYSKLSINPDPQALELGPAALYRVEVAGDIDRMLALVHQRPVGVLRKGNCRQSDLDRPLAAALHMPPGGVPRPFGMHVEVGRQSHRSSVLYRRSAAYSRHGRPEPRKGWRKEELQLQMRDDAAPGPLTQASAPFSGSPRNRQIPWGETAPARLGR